nr:hypothetical protein [Cohnella faecalis]
MKQLMSVTFPVPSRFITVPLAKLETMVPPAIVMDSNPAAQAALRYPTA